MSNGTMQAIRFHEYGGPEKLVLDTLERPAPKEGEVLLRVHAAGVNPVDWKFRAGYLQQWMPIQLPYVPGNDVAGTVEEVGPGVTEFQKGQAVYGLAQGGTYAQYVVMPASQLAPMPKNLSFDKAASVPVGALTAWHALFTYADLQAGQTVLVHGGAGGVGAFAVQLAHWKGATVIATASADNLDFVRSLGADTVIDYNATQFETVVRDVDVVVDTVGGDVLQRSWQVLRPGGILVSITEPPSEEEATKRGVRAAMVQTAFTGEDLRRITELIESGQLKPELGPVFRLTDADKAQELSQTRHGRGRIVLHIAD